MADKTFTSGYDDRPKPGYVFDGNEKLGFDGKDNGPGNEENYGMLLNEISGFARVNAITVAALNSGSRARNFADFRVESGDADASIAINAALVQAGVDGEPVLLLAGSFDCLDSTISLSTNNLVLSGLTGKSILARSVDAGSVNLIAVSGDSCAIQNLSFSSTAPTAGGRAIHCSAGGSNLRVTNCKSTGTFEIFANLLENNGLIKDCVVTGILTAGAIVQSGSRIIDCNIDLADNSANSAISITGDAQIDNVWMQGRCYVDLSGSGGDVTISNCRATVTGGTAFSTAFGAGGNTTFNHCDAFGGNFGLPDDGLDTMIGCTTTNDISCLAGGLRRLANCAVGGAIDLRTAGVHELTDNSGILTLSSSTSGTVVNGHIGGGTDAGTNTVNNAVPALV